MNTEKTENLNESRFVKAMRIIRRNWQQAIEDGMNRDCTIEQAKAYYTATGVISLIERELTDLLIYDDIEITEKITFDEKGHLI